MPWNQYGVWEDDDYASGGMLPGSSGSNGTSGVTLQPQSNTSGSGNASWQQFMSANPSIASQAPADYWIPPNASFGDDPSGKINQQNPFADPGKPFVQEGTTGGYLDGVGVTIGQGRSTTPQQAQAALDALVAKYGQETAYDWLRRNPGDFTRADEALSSQRTGDGLRDDARSALSSPSGGSGQQWGGNWFTDPATAQLEDVIKNQLNALQNPAANSPQALLQAFLLQRFQELAGSNGYSPEELALLRTQGLEPIEALRKASQERELQRTAAAGYLPTSGLTRLNQQQNDLEYDRLRTQAQRDLAVHNVNERTNRLNQAMQLGQLALQTERGTGDRTLQLATLLQQLPVQALNQALAVLGQTTSPSNLASIVAQMTAINNQQQYYNNAQNAALWGNIGAALADLFG